METAADLQAALDTAFGACDLLLMAAAVSDFRPIDPPDAKVKKDGRTGMTIELEATPDLLSGLAARRAPGQTLVGFAAEHGEGALEFATGKRERKGLDAIVLNDISQPGIGFDTPDNEVTIITAAGAHPVARADKAQIAQAILDAVDGLGGGAASVK